MYFTYLKTQDLIEIADQKRQKEGKPLIKNISSLSEQLELRYPEVYNYYPVYRYLSIVESERVRRHKDILFNHILQVLEIDQLEIFNRFIYQPNLV